MRRNKTAWTTILLAFTLFFLATAVKDTEAFFMNSSIDCSNTDHFFCFDGADPKTNVTYNGTAHYNTSFSTIDIGENSTKQGQNIVIWGGKNYLWDSDNGSFNNGTTNCFCILVTEKQYVNNNVFIFEAGGWNVNPTIYGFGTADVMQAYPGGGSDFTLKTSYAGEKTQVINCIYPNETSCWWHNNTFKDCKTSDEGSIGFTDDEIWSEGYAGSPKFYDFAIYNRTCAGTEVPYPLKSGEAVEATIISNFIHTTDGGTSVCGTSSSPCLSNVTSPYFNFTTSDNAHCRATNDSSLNFTQMGSARDCVWGQNTQIHNCTLNMSDNLTYGAQSIYVSCNTTVGNFINQPPWEFNFTVNTPPVAYPYITPNFFNMTSNLSCFHNATDTDGNTITNATYKWYNQSNEETPFTNFNLTADNVTGSTTNWTCSVFVFDGTWNSTAWYNATVFRNAPPTATPYIIPKFFNVTDNLSCFHNGTDTSDTIVNATFKWYNHTAEETPYTNSNLSFDNITSATLNWTCSVKVYDGNLNSTWYNFTSIRLGEATLPNITNITVSSTSITEDAYLNFSGVAIDETNVSYVYFEIYKDGVTGFDPVSNTSYTSNVGGQYVYRRQMTETGTWEFRGFYAIDYYGNIAANSTVKINITVSKPPGGTSGGGGFVEPREVITIIGNITPFCGDGKCQEEENNETVFSCPQDCKPPVRGIFETVNPISAMVGFIAIMVIYVNFFKKKTPLKRRRF